MSWGMRSGTYLEEYLKETDISKFEKLYAGADFYLDENDEIIEKVRGGKYVYIDWKTNLRYIMKREFLKTDRCDFSLGTDDFMDEQISMMLPLSSPYLDLINREIKRLHQMGFIERWLKEYLPKKDRCWKASSVVEVTNHTVTVDDMQGSFILLLIGFLAAVLSFFIEYLVKLYIRKFVDKQVIKPYIE